MGISVRLHELLKADARFLNHCQTLGSRCEQRLRIWTLNQTPDPFVAVNNLRRAQILLGTRLPLTQNFGRRGQTHLQKLTLASSFSGLCLFSFPMERDNSGCARFPIEEMCVILEHVRFRFGLTTTLRTARFIESV